MTVQAVIFDMDGVLVDSEGFYYERRKKFLASQGISLEAYPPSYFVGGNMQQFWSEFIKEPAEVAAMQAAYERYKETHPADYVTLLNPDVPSVLKSLKERKLKIGLASSSLMSEIKHMLTTTGLAGYFDCVVSGEQFVESKPHPAIYQHTLTCLAVLPQQAIAVEDYPKGIQAAKASGMSVFALKQAQELDQSQADIVLKRLPELLQYLPN